MVDRFMDPIERLVQGLIPGVDYLAWYRARVVAQALESSGKMTVDVVPDDHRIPPMARVSLKLGLPATEVKISPGAFVLVGWENGDPARPQAALWDGGEAPALKLVFNAIEAFVGGEVGAEPPPKGITYLGAEAAFFAALVSAVSTALSAAGAGGSIPALTAAFASFQSGAPTYLASRARVL